MAYDDLLTFHAFCLTNTGTRLKQYAHALAQKIAHGHTVVDLGAGSGLLAFLACQAGARRVHAIEASDATAFGERLAAANGFRDRVEFIRASSHEVTLHERVDAIVADIHDTFGLQRNGLATLFDARDRFLKPGGVLIPTTVTLLAAAVEAPSLYQRKVDVWSARVQGVDVSPLRPLAVNQHHAGRFDRAELLSEPMPIATIDLATTETTHAGGTAVTTAERNGTLHGICGCFVTTLADDVRIQNVPGDSETTNFAQAFFPVERPLRVSAGDAIAITIDTFDNHVTRWRVTVTGPDHVARGHFEHSTFELVALSPEMLRKSTDDYQPALNERGRMERALLDRFDGTHSAAELEKWLAHEFPKLLPSKPALTGFLKTMIERAG